MPKYLRIILKTIAWILIGMVVIFGVTWGLLQIPAVQLSITQKVAKWVKEKTQTPISVGGVDIDFFHTVVLENVYLEDRQQDTLAHIGRVGANIGLFNLFKKEIFLDEISIENATVHLHQTDSVFNFQFLIDAFADSTATVEVQDTLSTPSPWRYGLSRLSLNQIFLHVYDKTNGYELRWQLQKGKIDLEELAINQQTLRFDEIIFTETNFSYESHFAMPDTSPGTPVGFPETGWVFTVKNLTLEEANVKYEDHTKQRINSGLDYNHLQLTDLGLSIKNVQIIDSLIGGEIQSLTFIEKSGLTLKEFNGIASWTPSELSVRDLNLKTPKSKAFLTATLAYDTFQQLVDFAPTLRLGGTINNTSLAFRDLFLFAPHLKQSLGTPIANEHIFLEGIISGSPERLNGINWKASIGKATELAANFEIKDLIHPEEMKLVFDIKNVSTQYTEVQRLFKNPLPVTLAPLGDVTYTGTYNGTIYGGELKGNLATGAGSLSSDLYATFNKNYDDATYRGNLSLKDFDLGALIQNDSLGKLTLNATVEGSGISVETISTQLDAVVAEATFNAYTYQDLEIHGEIQQQQFTGKVDIRDKNIKLDFDGEINFNDSIPDFHFTAILDTLNLKNLNLSEDSIGIHGEMVMDLSGNSPESLNGLAEIRNLRLSRADLRYAEDTIRLDASIKGHIRKMKLSSDFAKMDLEGDYRFVSLPRLMINFINDYFPIDQFLSDVDQPDSLKLEPEPTNNPPDQSFNFSLKLFKPGKILRLFDPEIKNLDSLFFTASMNSKNRALTGNLKIPGFQYADFITDSINIDMGGDPEKVNVFLFVENFRTSNAPEQVNMYGGVSLGDNKLNADIRIEKDSLDKLLQIGTVASFENKAYQFTLKENFFLNNLKWQIDSTHSIQLDATSLSVSNLVLTRGKQELAINGNSRDSLNIHFDKFKVAEISALLGYEDYELNGRIAGDVHVMDLNTNPFFTADLGIRDISLNEEAIGDWIIKTGISQDGNRVNIDTKMRGKSDFDVNGTYDINETAFNLETDIRNFQLSILNPFVGEYLSETSGFMKGNLNIDGTIDKPQMTGIIGFQQAAARINYLNTYYKLKDEKIILNPGSINFEKFSLADTLKGKGELNGQITHKFFSQIKFNLNFSSNKFQFLNTKKGDNDLFYGNMLLDMDAQITGTLENTKMAIKAKTLPGTDLVVLTPTDESGVVQEDYIVFVPPSTFDNPAIYDSVGSAKNYKANLLGYNIDLQLEITPDAKLTYVIDPISGDNIEIQGRSNLNVSINSLGDISILGNYEATSGKYRFSFENIVKREFLLNPGSRVTFIGDPFESLLDITAVFKTRTPVYDLISSQLTDPNGSVAQEARRRSDVEVLLYIKGKALKPDLSFNVLVPEAESGGVVSSSLTRRLAQIRENESELNKQVFGLLLFNSFVGDNQSGIGGANLTTVAASSVSNFINGQLNSLADKYVKGIEININLESYQSTYGGETSAISELEVGLSKQLFNERMTVSVGTGIGLETSSLEQASSTALTQISGNFVLSYKLTEDGRYSLRVFRKSDADDSLNGGGNTRVKTGVGASYKKSF